MSPTIGRPGLIRSETNEWSSPAFVKRARVAYGSLFEYGYDMFADEDGTVKGKGRKRTRFSRESGGWRYSSRSTSPEPRISDEEMVDSSFIEPDEKHKPQMTDEGCQTLELEVDNAAETLAIFSGQQGVPVDGSAAEIAPATPEPHPISSDTLSMPPAVTPPHAHTQKTVQSREAGAVEDLYGLSPTADGHVLDAAPIAGVERIETNHVGLQAISENDHYEPSNQIESSQPALPDSEHHDALSSPNKLIDATLQAYPELEYHDNIVQNGPYYSEEFQGYRDVDSSHVHQQSESRWDMHTKQVRSPSTVSIAEHRLSHDISKPILSGRHLSPGGVAMSRSQSGHSEMIDLTEDSEEEAEEPADDARTDSERENEKHYQEGQFENQSGDEDQRYEDGTFVEDGYVPVAYDLNDDDEAHIRYPPGFHSVDHIRPGQVADEDDEIEEGEFEEDDNDEEQLYDDKNASDRERTASAIKGLPRSEPEVIDLLSSDDEDLGEEDASRDPSEARASAVAMMNTMAPAESDVDEESDVESSDEEMTEDASPEEDPLNETRLIQVEESTKPAITEESERSVDESVSEEDESEVESENEIEPDRYAKHKGNPSDLTVMGIRSADVRFDITEKSATEESRIFTRYGGHDGASDGPDQQEAVSRDSEEKILTAAMEGDDKSMSGVIIYPALPHDDAGEDGQRLMQEKTTRDESPLGTSRNDQLPTPDATQLTAVVAHDTSFGSLNSSQPLLDKLGLIESTVDDVQDSSQRQAMNAIEGRIYSAPIAESVTDAVTEVDTDAATDAPENIIAETLIEAVAEAPLEAATEIDEETTTEAVMPAPVTPRRSKRISFSEQQRQRLDRSPSINMDEPTTPGDYDDSVELAMAALDSPSRQDLDEQPVSNTTLKVMLSRPLRTDLGNFTTLKLIRFNLEKKLDVLAIVTSLPPEPQRAKGGQRHYHLRFNITDATIAPSSVVTVNIFRPFRQALPNVQPGESVLLRNFMVKSEARAGFSLRSDEGSSWVVFKNGGEEEVRGPPVEYGDDEREHIVYLKTWYRKLDSKSRDRLEKANEKVSDTGRSMGRVL